MTQKLTEYQSKWGNLYRTYYFLDGRRISEARAEEIFATQTTIKIKGEHVGTDWRDTWSVT